MYNPGDVLCVQYTGFKHYGLYIGNNLVIHNSKKFKKVCEIALEEFADGKEIRASNIKAEDPSLAIQTAQKYINVPYDLFSENCEHFVRTVCGLAKESTQLQKYLCFAFGIGLMKSDNKILKLAGGATAFFSLLTPSEQSPVKNAAVAACLVTGLALLMPE